MNENTHRIDMTLLKEPSLFIGLLAHLLDERFSERMVTGDQEAIPLKQSLQ